MKAECCDEAQTAYNVDWMDLVLCQAACLDWPCFHDCEVRHAGAVQKQDALFDCFLGAQCGAVCAAAPQCGLLGVQDPTCGACFEQECCAESAAIGAVESFDFLACYNGCQQTGGGVDCTKACATLWGPETGAPVVVAINCLVDQCSASCGGAGSGCGQASLLVPSACAACIRDSCCAEGEACGGDLACTELEMCIHACPRGDSACRAACEADFPGGVTLYGALETCTTANCDTECP